MSVKILFTGGGTAGHVFPIVALARELRRTGLAAEFFYVGPKDDWSTMFLSHEGIKTKWILAGKVRRYFTWRAILDNLVDILFKTPLGFLQSFFYIFSLAPDLLFSKGGYGSISPVLACSLLQVPIIIHESDATPGFANRFGSKFTSRVLVAFPVAQTEYFSERKMVTVGNPIRSEIMTGVKEEAKDFFNLTGEKPVILVMGGSQGAEKINDLILAILPQILPEFEIIHQTGEKNEKSVQNEAKVMVDKDLEKYYHPVGFLKEVELRDVYQAADFIVSRAGAGSIFEIAAVGKPSILIPLAISAQDHQAKNAYAYAQKGAAIVVEEANLTPRFFLEKMKYLFLHPEELQKMSQKAKEFAKLDSAKIIAQYILDSLTK
jgi:UDP-N-acetylglucosamine--N-acetylmuramyl-(pentapeptide) pyrophosphoryl-undecaprenol N-acetylglucosamine transferase